MKNMIRMVVSATALLMLTVIIAQQWDESEQTQQHARNGEDLQTKDYDEFLDSSNCDEGCAE